MVVRGSSRHCCPRERPCGPLRAAIYWRRQTAVTNRGLLLLPGILSLREEKPRTIAPPVTLPPPPPVDNDNAEDDEKAMANLSNKGERSACATLPQDHSTGKASKAEAETCSTKIVEVVVPTGKASATTAQDVTRHPRILGRLERVQSGEPVLTLGDGITMQGRTLETRSKFLVLQLLPAKKGARHNSQNGHGRQQVLYQGVFSSITVFGQGTVVTTATPSCTSEPTEAVAGGDDGTKNHASTTTSWNHYGASERTVDGSLFGRKLLSEKPTHTGRYR